MHGILVTGTDTGVGKTVVACALIAALRERGRRVAPWKPVETGWDARAPERTDAARLAAAAGVHEAIDLVCPYRFRAPVAPVVAAAAEGVRIDVGHLETLYRARAERADVVIVEGAGGLLVPIVERVTYLDLARRLGLSLLIVAANRLGVVNHTVLTAHAAAAAGVHVLGFVLNDVAPGGRPQTTVPDTSDAAPPDMSRTTNKTTITELSGLACLGEIPYTPDAGNASAMLAAHLDVDAVLEAFDADRSLRR
jgi:dethiobiotin synthetase